MATTSTTSSISSGIEANDPKDWSFQQVMLRVKDPKKSIEYYKANFGMRLVEEKHFPDMEFSLYFLASIPPEVELPKPGTKEANAFLWTMTGTCLELTHNYGTEKEVGQVYDSGNNEPNRGYGHCGFLVDDVTEFSKSLMAKGVEFKKKPWEGNMKTIAFAYDPDGYWVEIVPRTPESKGWGKGPSFQQAMLRIKDPKRSLDFYRDHLGMTVVEEKHFPQWKFSLYFLATLPKGTVIPAPGTEEAKAWLNAYSGTVLELTHNHGTEDDDSFSYHNGNSDPKGFGHVGFLVDDVHKACEELEKSGYAFQKKPDDGKMKGLAFAKDPDGYWVEIIKRGWEPGFQPSHVRSAPRNLKDVKGSWLGCLQC